MTGYIYRGFIIHHDIDIWTICDMTGYIPLGSGTFTSASDAEKYIDFNYRIIEEPATW